MTPDLFEDQIDTAPLYADRYPMRPHPAGGHTITIPDGELLYIPHFFKPDTSDRAMHKMLANDCYPVADTDWRCVDLAGVNFETIRWQQDVVNMFGKQLPLPRLTAWHGDNDRAYTFSGLTLNPAPWNPVLNWFRNQLSKVTDAHFNSVLLNWYRDGGDHISWHTDAEPELGTNPTIASINLGVTRRFVLRRMDDHKHKIELPLDHGCLLVMSGPLQHYWQHSIPKQAKISGHRINMTFRHIL